MRRILLVLWIGVASVAAPAQASAFSHIVQPAETLAQIAERIYGSPRFESVLVGANALDVQGGSIVVPGMRLEIPAPGHHRVGHGEGWTDLALSWLGSGDVPRADLLARSNKGVVWVPPTEGQEIEIPAVLTYIAADGDTVNAIAARFWGDGTRGWELNPYNGRDGAAVAVKRGEIVLVPMPELRLTEAGRTEARAAADRDGATAGTALDQQRRADADLPDLAADVRHGRYVRAVARGNRILMSSALTHPQLGMVHRELLEAYSALGDLQSAAEACAAWKANDPGASLDPARQSPKIIEACATR
jgi:LysM repeat protein